MKKEALENINSDLFNSFNPDDNLWVIGGTTYSASISYTFGTSSPDTALEGDIDGTLEEEIGSVV